MHSSPIIDRIFDGCVQLLRWLGGVVGMSYKAINVWIFCVLWPMFTILLLIIIFRQRMKIRALAKRQP